jgi:hypothetical protein
MPLLDPGDTFPRLTFNLPGGQAIEVPGGLGGGSAFSGRSLRQRPQLRSLGVSPGETGIREDWHGGSRRLKG